MSIMNLIKTSISSIKAHKLRVFLTMIGIIIGISSVVTILSVGDGLKAEVNRSMEGTSANKYNITFTPENSGVNVSVVEYFNKSDIEEIKRISKVQKVEESQGNIGGISIAVSDISYFDKQSYILIDSYENKTINVEYGRLFKKGEENKNLIVLSNTVAKDLFEEVENAIGKGVTLSGTTYEVIGILAPITGFTLFDNSYISEVNKSSINISEGIYSLDVYIEPDGDIDEIFKDIKSTLERNHPNLDGEYILQDPQEITKAFEKIIGGLTVFITCITGISLFVGGIGVMNIMYVSVTERKREIGIRRAIGAKPMSILFQFLFEAILVTGMGGLIGILLGYLFSKIVGVFTPFPPVLTATSFIGATLTSVLVGIVFGIIPAYNASKLDPIKAIYK